MSVVGTRVLRLEDGRLLRGAGRFVDDVDLPRQLWLRVVRADIAHGRIRAVGTEAARRLRGVHAVMTGDDLGRVEPIPLRLDFGIELERYLQPLLARERGPRARGQAAKAARNGATGAHPVAQGGDSA